MACGAGVHHRVRREWLTRLRSLQQHHDELLTAGQLLAGVHRHASTRSKAGLLVDLEAYYGTQLLFEVEAFLAEEFSSHADAVALLSECAAAALGTVESYLARQVELKVHPQWHAETLYVLREVHRKTLVRLRTRPTAAEPLPAYRWRLPARASAAVREQMRRRCPAVDDHRGTLLGHDWAPQQVVALLKSRGLRRVFVLHPFFPIYSCETDVELLGIRFDWMDLHETHLTAHPFDWFIHLGDLGEWDAVGWPLRHDAVQGP